MDPLSEKKKGVLTVHAKLTVDDGQHFQATEIQQHIRVFLLKSHPHVRIGRITPSSDLSAMIDRVDIVSVSECRKFPDTNTYRVTDHELRILVYKLHRAYQETWLPHVDFDSHWDALIYDEPVGERLLRVLCRAIRKFSDRPAELLANAWYSNVLLHGVPGSGKTSLATALAQQLSIHLSDLYPHARFIQVNTSALFSHLYGNTPKEVAKVFTTVSFLATGSEAEPERAEPELVVVLIDEFDKLVPCRKAVCNKNEPQDTIRTTVEVSTCLDKLRKLPNVCFLFTTNLISDLDSAFIDRCILQEQIDAPGANAVFELLRTDLNAKIRQGSIALDSMVYDKPADQAMSDADVHYYPEAGPRADSLVEIPKLVWATEHWSSVSHSAVSIIHGIAAKAAGFSARSLRALVDLAIFEAFGEDVTPQLRDVLAALEVIVDRKVVQAEVTQDGPNPLQFGEPSTSSTSVNFSEFDFVADLPIETNVYSDDE